MTWVQQSLFTDKELGITPGIIGLSGYAQSGKDTVAKILIEEYGYERLAFADNVRNVLLDINPFLYGEPLNILVAAEGWEGAKKNPLVRRMLQALGESVRKHVDQEAWVMAVLRQMDPTKKYVIPDVRFTNEATTIKLCDGQIWRVSRSGHGPVNNHISEVDMDSYTPDHYIQNDGSLEDLAALVRALL